MKIGIVVSMTYWEEITSKMLKLSVKTLEDNNVEPIIVKVPGTFEIPFAVKKMIGTVDGVITLGAVITGKTDHDKAICYSVNPALLSLSLEHNKPVVLGINGPNMTKEQAIKRISRAQEVTLACIQMTKK